MVAAVPGFCMLLFLVWATIRRGQQEAKVADLVNEDL